MRRVDLTREDRSVALDRIELSEIQEMGAVEFDQLLDRIDKSGRHLVLDEDGVPKFVLVPYEWWRRMVPGRPVDKDEADQVRGE